jgi:histidyl-tRNA synthetase
MRMYSEGMRERPKPLKLFYFGSVFRYERPQSGRYREFWHFGTELIGPETERADAENIALAVRCLEEAGLDDHKIRISNLQILETYLEEMGIPEEEREDIYHQVDKEEDVDILEPLLGKSLKDIKDELGDSAPVEYLESVFDSLENYGITKDDYEFDLRIVRGLDYYKGVVFEIDAEELDAQKQICGGGDYELGEIFDLDISSKGFAFGFDRVLLALEKTGKAPEPKAPDCYLIPIGEESLSYSYDVLQKLRDNGITADIDLMDRGVGKDLGYADKMDFKLALLIGGDEVENETVTIKDMKSGDQNVVDKKDILEEVRKSGIEF